MKIMRTRLGLCLFALALGCAQAGGQPGDPQAADAEWRQAFCTVARPSISRLLADTEARTGQRVVFVPLPNDDPVAASYAFDPGRNEPRIHLRKDWQDVDVAHELMHVRMDLIGGFSVLAWREGVEHTPATEAAFGRLQSYVQDEVVHAELVGIGLQPDGEVFRPSLFDSVYAHAADYLEEGRDRANDGMAHLDKLGRGPLCRVCFLVQAELLLKNYRTKLPERRVRQTERFIRAFRAHRGAEAERADLVLALFREHDVRHPAGLRAILAAWARMEGLESFVGPSEYRKAPNGRILLPFPE